MKLTTISEHKEVRQANALTEARFEMTATELDLFFYLLGLLKRDNPTKKHQISITELQRITGKEYKYSQLRESTEKMGSRMYEYVRENGNLLQVWIFSSCEYISGHGIIEVELSDKITPFLFDLKEQFTSFRLYAALKMSSKYAKRIYAMLSQWKDIGIWRTSIEDLKTRLKLFDPKGKEAEQYKQISQLKGFVLDPAIEQINEYSELKVSYELIKKGRSFTEIEFKIDLQNPKVIINIDFSQDPKEQRCAQNLEEIGIKRNDLLEQIAKNEDLRQKTFKWYHDWKLGKFGKVGNPAGLLLKTLGLV